VANTIIGDGCLTKTEVDILNTALAQSGLGNGAASVTTLAASGATTLSSTLAVTGASTLSGAVTCGSTLAVTGILTALVGGNTLSLTAITASGAIATGTAANYIITKAGVAAMTLGAPTATTDDGKLIWVSSSTNYAHTVTATGLLQTGSSKTDVATFAAYAGAGVMLMAYQAKWIVIYSVGVTFS